MKKLFFFLVIGFWALGFYPASAGVIHVEGPRVMSAGAATPTPSPSPSATPMDHVADANARLSIAPTGKTAGYRVIQDDGPTTYEFQGAGKDSDAGLWVTGAGDTVYNGPYTFDGSTYTLVGNARDCHTDISMNWVFGSPVDYSGDTSTYAWQASWTTFVGTPPAPTVARNPIASEANWTIVP